jgi:hypothetical protein
MNQVFFILKIHLFEKIRQGLTFFVKSIGRNGEKLFLKLNHKKTSSEPVVFLAPKRL